MDISEKQRIVSKIRQLLQQKGWNQAELARRSGISTDNLSRYLSCKYVPNIKHLTHIANALQVELSDLLTDLDAQVDRKYCMELKTLRNDPTKALIRIYELVPTAVAVQIISLVNDAKSHQTSTGDLLAPLNPEINPSASPETEARRCSEHNDHD